MKEAQFYGPGKKFYYTIDDPEIKDRRDVIIKVTSTAILGSDLHLFSGGIPQPRPMVLGYAFMGIVEEAVAQLPEIISK